MTVKAETLTLLAPSGLASFVITSSSTGALYWLHLKNKEREQEPPAKDTSLSCPNNSEHVPFMSQQLWHIPFMSQLLSYSKLILVHSNKSGHRTFDTIPSILCDQYYAVQFWKPTLCEHAKYCEPILHSMVISPRDMLMSPRYHSGGPKCQKS